MTLSCEDAARLVSDAQERRLTFSERWGLRAHLAICTGCRRFRQQLKAIESAARKLAGQDCVSSDQSVAARERIAAGLRDRLGPQ
ncbi:MAG: hypothetical protein CMJ58_07060 [Planctomycetaceae bacterium]|nr:hypothetical protein [Planctomycetaceae bacterium]